MKANKGFTLIELLAVIVILAIIALIATPIVMGVIDDARQGAEKGSAYAYIRALEQDIAVDMALGTTQYTDSYKTSGQSVAHTTPDATLVKTTAPKSVSLVVSNGIVISGEIKVDQYTFTYANSKLTVK